MPDLGTTGFSQANSLQVPRIPDSLRVIAMIPGATEPGLDLTKAVTGLKWTTAAIGGYGSADVEVDGDPSRWSKLVKYLSVIRVYVNEQVLFEGRVEDKKLRWANGELRTTITAYGLQRLLSDVSVRRIWSDRSMNWVAGLSDHGFKSGCHQSNTPPTILYLDPSTWADVSIGQFDPTDLTRIGVQFKVSNPNITITLGSSECVVWYTGGATLVELIADISSTGGKVGFGVWSSPDGINWTEARCNGSQGSKTTYNISLAAGTRWLMLAAVFYASTSGNIQNFCAFENMRALGVFTTEDTTGGFYGGTILKDLIGLVPGLSIGTIESGNDFTIQEIHRAVRTAALDVVNEVAGYYTREWAVWDSDLPGVGRFNWQSVDFSSPQWIVPLDQCQELEIDGSADGVNRTVYVTYTDAATQFSAEKSATSSGSQTNPFVTANQTKDYVLAAPVQMVDNSAAQLATLTAQDTGGYVPIGGRIVVAFDAQLETPNGKLPAFMIRSGQNLLIPDLPKTDLFARGRDGETMFHITGTSVDLIAGTVEIELEGLVQEIDVILARLAEAARFPTSPGSPLPPAAGRGYHGPKVKFNQKQ